MDKLIAEALFTKLNLDSDDPNLKDTPERVKRLFSELFIPKEHAKEIIKNIFDKIFPTTYSGIVMVSNIIVYSVCPHHLLPVEYEIDIAYIPGSGMMPYIESYAIGLSKLERIADTLSNQLILQETLTDEIADTLMKGLNAKGVAVILKGIHLCMRMRGIKSKRSVAITSTMRGAFKDHPATRQEFFELLNHSRR